MFFQYLCDDTPAPKRYHECPQEACSQESLCKKAGGSVLGSFSQPLLPTAARRQHAVGGNGVLTAAFPLLR